MAVLVRHRRHHAMVCATTFCELAALSGTCTQPGPKPQKRSTETDLQVEYRLGALLQPLLKLRRQLRHLSQVDRILA